jgi:ribosomal protein S12 methylthiotransferase accessory factor
MRHLLDTLNELNLADERPVAALIGLAPDAGSLWADLRVGELKDPARAGRRRHRCHPRGLRMGAPVRPARRRPPPRLPLHRHAARHGRPEQLRRALVSLFGDDTLDMASDLIDGEVRFFGLQSPGLRARRLRPAPAPAPGIPCCGQRLKMPENRLARVKPR